MGRLDLPAAEISRLYLQEGLSQAELAARFGVSRGTIRDRLVAGGVPLRSQIEALQPKGRRSAPSSVTARAYMLGLAWGDFAVERFGPASRTISLRCSTTHREQVELAREVFSPFGLLYLSDWPGGVTSIRVSLDDTFAFLFEKHGFEVPGWALTPAAAPAFAAGYVDAEGSFGVYDGRARFKVDSYDEAVLRALYQWCGTIGVSSRLLRIGAKGERRRDGSHLALDLWRLNVNEAASLLRFAATLEPFLRHERRCCAMARARSNVLERLRRRARPQPDP